jgi:glycosyltransferase involved in cell wall biosynthesis
LASGASAVYRSHPVTVSSELPRRIALIAPLWYPIAPDRGGIEQVVFLLARELVGRGHEVTLLASADSTAPGRLVPVCERGIVAAMEAREAAEYSYYEATAIARTLRLAHEFDVVHSHLTGALVPFSSLLPVPVLHTMHCPVSRDISWLAAQFPDAHLSTVSRHLADSLTGVNNVAVVPNGIDMAEFRLYREPGDYLLFLGRIERAKGVQVAIDVAEAVGLPLVLAGNATDREFFAEHVAGRDPRRVRYVGRVTGADKVDLLGRARALLFPSLEEETFGLVIVEAMACGTPVVALRRGAVAEIVCPGVNGFHAADVAELPALVRRVAEVDRAGVRASVIERFSHQRMVDAYVELYRRLCER